MVEAHTDWHTLDGRMGVLDSQIVQREHAMKGLDNEFDLLLRKCFVEMMMILVSAPKYILLAIIRTQHNRQHKISSTNEPGDDPFTTYVLPARILSTSV